MKYFRIWCSIVVAMAMWADLSAQSGADIYKVIKANNGQNYLLAQANTGGVLYTDVYFRMGTIYEQDSVSGISLMLTRIIDARMKAALKGRNIRYTSSIEPTQMGFHFESGAGDLDYVLTLIHDKVMFAKFDEESVEEAKAEIQADLDSIAHSEQGRTDMLIKKHLWGKDFKKLDVYGDRSTYKKITPEQFARFHDKLFLPLNNAIAVTGTFSEQEVLAKLQKTFDDFRTREFNPEQINRVIEFKPMINAVQIVSRTNGPAQMTVTYQSPGARGDRSATYAAYMLTALINDKGGRIARSMGDAGIADLKAVFDCHNFEGTLTISAKITSANYVYAFGRVDSMIAGFQKKDYFNDDELSMMGKSIQQEFKEIGSHTHDYITSVARYRFSNDENYFPTLSDSIQSVSVGEMQRYISEYIQGRAGVKCLYIDTAALNAAPAGQRFYPLDESVADVTFAYPQNVTDIDTIAGKENLQRLIQWLTINSDVQVQVNGYSDKSEYIKSYDTTVTNFIKRTPTFRKAMPDAIKVGYLRVEMMRAMKIAKALYEAGITEDRISGTSMVFNSDSDEGAANNRKCTVTLDKIHPRVSLYEYHFGKKKEEDTLPKQ